MISVGSEVQVLPGPYALRPGEGGGGLGRLAYNYGYQRFQPEVMVVVLVILVLLVQVVQLAGDALIWIDALVVVPLGSFVAIKALKAAHPEADP